MPPLAVITMVYNERDRLPYWLAHYRRQVGLDHCYVVDHGSDDRSTADLGGANRILLPRSPQDNERRTRFISQTAAALLLYYRRVAYVDADELLVADPAKYENLSAYATKMRALSVTSVGLEIVQTADEAPLSLTQGVGAQRSSAIFSSSMCKTNMIGRRVNWAPGWHAHNGEPRFEDLYLFHLRHADLDQALGRLSITRAMPWVSEHAGKHQRVDDEWMRNVMRFFGNRPMASGGLIGQESPLAEDMAAFIRDSKAPVDQRQPYSVPLARYGAVRIMIDAALREALSETPVPFKSSAETPIVALSE
mgnify:CR=1 FL=1